MIAGGRLVGRTPCGAGGAACVGRSQHPSSAHGFPHRPPDSSRWSLIFSLVMPLCVPTGGRRFLYCVAHTLSQRLCLPVTGGADVRFARHVSIRLSGIRHPPAVCTLPGGAAARRSVRRTAWQGPLRSHLPCLSLSRQPARAGASLAVVSKNDAHPPGKSPAPRNAHHPDVAVSHLIHSRTSLVALQAVSARIGRSPPGASPGDQTQKPGRGTFSGGPTPRLRGRSLGADAAYPIGSPPPHDVRETLFR